MFFYRAGDCSQMMHSISCHDPRLLDRHQEFDGARRDRAAISFRLASAVNCKPMPTRDPLQCRSQVRWLLRKTFFRRLASQAGGGYGFLSRRYEVARYNSSSRLSQRAGWVRRSILGAAGTFLRDRLSRFADNKTWLHGYLRSEFLGIM